MLGMKRFMKNIGPVRFGVCVLFSSSHPQKKPCASNQMKGQKPKVSSVAARSWKWQAVETKEAQSLRMHQ